MDTKIDFVVTWVDSDDPEWQKEYSKYKESDYKARFRTWDLFKYWFRAVEQFAPWVNKVYLVTNGKNPEWINANNPKLVLIKHSDYIPKEYLPTFNSHTIELNMNRIPGLSEHFVYFNDDCYLNAPISPEYYFKKGLPCDDNQEKLCCDPTYNPLNRFNVRMIEFCDLCLLSYHFKRKDVVKQNPKNWFGLHLGFKGIIRSIILTRWNKFEFFYMRHHEQPFLRSVFDEVWDKEETMMKASCTRFRKDDSLNPYFIRYWQFASNKFYPINFKTGQFYILKKDNLENIHRALSNQQIKSLCLNDSPVMAEEEYDEVNSFVESEFEKKFPNKSSFEI